MEQSERLLLVPGGYPLWIDVPEASIDGAATAMRFELPLHGHNLPLMHRRESKWVVALKGELELRTGRQRQVLLREGEAVKLQAGTAHRIHQHGAHPSTVGIVLWPGAVEQAFRELAALAASPGFAREAMVDILDRYAVVWTNRAHEAGSQHFDVRTLGECLETLSPQIAQPLMLKWTTPALLNPTA
ncbi:Cupin domain-containing protein [Pseudomonas sp. IT-P12]|uniref:cupin domain-containing protein n=1 Tax=Pseudomonas sp. IT-P12 TaxID=3026450 RepID=UPI0039E077E2